MHAQDSLRKELLLQRRASEGLVSAILAALREIDPSSSVVDMAGAMSARVLVKRLWDLLPDEHHAYAFESLDELITQGSWCLNGLGDPRVTLCLGWDGLSVHSSLHAAWTAWPRFASLNTATFNSLIVPESLAWYIARSGQRLYPMNCSASARPELLRPPPGA
ncbi:MAG: hypothetical protein WC538_11495 [Thermoanaerobaculia bacterium]|jgi:hypothetical protein